MERRELLLGLGVPVLAGCTAQETSEQVTSETTAGEGQTRNTSTTVKSVRKTPKSCDSGSFVVEGTNRTDSPQTIRMQLFDAGEQILSKQSRLVADDAGKDSFSVYPVGCWGETYRVEVEVVGRATVEKRFTAKEGGGLVAFIRENEVEVKYQLKD